MSELIRIHPESIGVKNYGGDLPIHVACREGASKEVIEAILNGDEFESVKVADCEGRLPLHLAASNQHISPKTIQNLILVNDRATRIPDDFNLLPLHWACSKNASPRVVETIIQAYPYAVEAQDAWGRSPLALAKMSKNPEKATIVELLSRDVSSWTTAMMSTVVTLSNKVMEAEKMEEQFKEQNQTIESLNQVNEKKERHVDTLKLELKLLEERFVDEIQYLQQKHMKELKQQKAQSDETIARLTKEKEEAEKKLAGLKKLVDEVVSQLKQHQSIVEDKEADRKKLKQKAIALLKKIEDHKQSAKSTFDENKKLKDECSNLQDELERRDEQMKELRSSFQQPMRILHNDSNDNDIRALSTLEESYDETAEYGHNNRYNNQPRERVSSYNVGNYCCTKLDDGSSASYL